MESSCTSWITETVLQPDDQFCNDRANEAGLKSGSLSKLNHLQGRNLLRRTFRCLTKHSVLSRSCLIHILHYFGGWLPWLFPNRHALYIAIHIYEIVNTPNISCLGYLRFVSRRQINAALYWCIHRNISLSISNFKRHGVSFKVKHSMCFEKDPLCFQAFCRPLYEERNDY